MTDPVRRPPPDPDAGDEAARRERIERNRPLVALLDSWLEDSEEPSEEERELFNEFMRDIDANRGERKLFERYLK